ELPGLVAQVDVYRPVDRVGRSVGDLGVQHEFRLDADGLDAGCVDALHPSSRGLNTHLSQVRLCNCSMISLARSKVRTRCMNSLTFVAPGCSTRRSWIASISAAFGLGALVTAAWNLVSSSPGTS